MRLQQHISESAKDDHTISNQVFKKLPSNYRKYINDLKKEFDKNAYNDDIHTIMSIGRLSPSDHTVIDKAQMWANKAFKKHPDIMKMLNPKDILKYTDRADNFIMSLWDLYN